MPTAVRHVARRAVRTFGAVATELGWIGTHLAAYPRGLLSDGLSRLDAGRTRRATPSTASRPEPRLTRWQRGAVADDVTVACTPIVLVHGIGDNHTIFDALAARLHRRGFTSTWTFDYPLRTMDVRTAARRLGEAIDQLRVTSGYERVQVVGHSLGGLIARYLVQRCDGDAAVDTVVTLGTPHQGTEVARWAPALPLVRQLRPDSDLIRELAAPAPACRTHFVAVHSEVDHLIVPGWRGRLDHPDLSSSNRAVPYVGHMSLTRDAGVAHLVASALRARRPATTTTTGHP